MFNEKIKPSLVLTLICIITCALLVIAYNATYVDNSGVITDKMLAGLEEIYGTSEGYTMLDTAPEGIDSVLTDGTNTAYEITEDGYSKGGLHVLVGLNADGSVAGVSILTIGETPGLGTKVQDSSFRDQFKGLTYDKLPKAAAEEASATKKYVWGEKEEITALKAAAEAVTPSDEFQLDAVTGATFSSKGMNRAVTTALNAYNESKGAQE
ncbi:MAG: FMN-binding protein [Oscillospiraceae bacterium]